MTPRPLRRLNCSFGVRTSNDGPSPIELRPEPFQERLLEQIALARERGHHRNLLVSATGTAKTVMAAIPITRGFEITFSARDCCSWHTVKRSSNRAWQHFATAYAIMRSESCGSAGRRPRSKFDHVFASIQSLYAAGFGFLQFPSTTSTWSLSTNFITLLRGPIARFSSA